MYCGDGAGFFSGKRQIDSVEVVALFSGVCKVNAAIAAQLLIDVFCVDIIINSGTAGGMEPELEIFDTVKDFVEKSRFVAN